MVMALKTPKPVSDNARRLKQLRTRAGFKVRELAELLEWSGHTRVQYYEDEFKAQHIPLRIVEQFAVHLVGRGTPAITEEEVYALAGMKGPPVVEQPRLNMAMPERRAPPAAAPPAPPLQRPPPIAGGLLPDDRDPNRLMTVWASAEGGEQGAMIITISGPIDYIPRPKQLTFQAFAVQLIGDSMSPAYEDGDQLYVDPDKRPRPGHDCLFVRQIDETTYVALAKRLVRPTEDHWLVRQFNPAKDFKLPRSQWKQIWRVCGKVNRD